MDFKIIASKRYLFICKDYLCDLYQEVLSWWNRGAVQKIFVKNYCKMKDLYLIFFIVCKSLSSTWKAPAMPNLLQTLNFAPASMPTLHLGQKCTGSSVKCRPALQKRFLLHMHVLRLHRPICNTWKRKDTYPAKSVIYKWNQKA